MEVQLYVCIFSKLSKVKYISITHNVLLYGNTRITPDINLLMQEHISTYLIESKRFLNNHNIILGASFFKRNLLLRSPCLSSLFMWWIFCNLIYKILNLVHLVCLSLKIINCHPKIRFVLVHIGMWIHNYILFKYEQNIRTCRSYIHCQIHTRHDHFLATSCFLYLT